VTPLYPHKLALTLPTGGGRSVGIVRWRTKATEFSFIVKKYAHFGWKELKEHTTWEQNLRWECNIKVDLKNIVHEDLGLISLIQDNGHILSFVGMAMNHRNVHNLEKFISNCSNLERGSRG
jgi:hypothetical protein